MAEEASLGLATTEELIDELQSRLMDIRYSWRVNRIINMTIALEMIRGRLSSEELEYRTIDSD